MNKVVSSHMPELAEGIQFVPIDEDNQHAFYEVNAPWIEEMFVLEPIDEQVLRNPMQEIVAKGGEVWLAKHHELGYVGACALLNAGDGNWELTKMGVLKKAQSLKIGEALLRFMLARASALQARTLFLLSNSKCEAAVHLYERNGFVHDAQVMHQYGSIYERCNVAMKFVGV